MKRYVLMFWLIALPATANQIDEAATQVGKTYVCGADHEFRASVEALKTRIEEAGVPTLLSQFAVDGYAAWIKKEYTGRREEVSAEACGRILKP